ncbi:DUF6443 domain-containing protein [Chitinophaga flava]|uniref:DUF6443 domain-containing protein n=1 Tax=Chitinophaga flava TaxID=2259036 RepID=A0A365XRW8_9BACT|nr:DUF6443 domain-containing protein [Chitinophaga flava]RBL88335.1 hypothetical protein DF182_17220 [Chitinophaga flava]
MRHLWILFSCLLHVVFLSAQNKPGGSAIPSAVPVTVPAAYTGAKINYIRTWEPSMPISNPTIVVNTGSIDQVKQQTQYFDGLGRPLQTVVKGISPSGKDLVTPIIYDVYGRVQYGYLPYVSPDNGDGKFKTDPFNAQAQFHLNNANALGSGECIYYNRTTYEASPLNRVLKTYAAGNSWALEGGNKPVEQQVSVNTTADAVRIWHIAAGDLFPATSNAYTPGALLKNITINEQGERVVTFTDKAGHMILKRVALSAVATDGPSGWLCTYYVYDDNENLRCAIPPKAVELMGSTWAPASVKDLCFFYRYDERKRMIMKKVPDADSSEMVYDIRDRLVFSRDGNLQNQWLATFYDEVNRPVMTALYNTSAGRAPLQTGMNSTSGGTQTLTHIVPPITNLVVASFDGRARYVAANSITAEAGFDTGPGASTTLEIDGTASQASVSVNANNPLPGISNGDLVPLTYTFYDNYDFPGAQTFQSGEAAYTKAGSNPYPVSNSIASNYTKGVVTGTRVKVLGTTDQWIVTTLYYDDKGRTIQQLSTNVSGGTDITTNLYDFNGKLLSSYLRHHNQRSGTISELRELTMLHYDAAGRLDSVKKRLNDTSVLKTVAVNTYDELSRLLTKRLGITSSTSQMETLTYDYTQQGWLKGINRDYVNTAGSTTNWFGEELSYDQGFTTNQLNGNIAGAKWKSRGDGIARSYGYSYDPVSRLTVADFTQQNSGSGNWTNDQIDFSVKDLSYDANGNIQYMTQRGMATNLIQTIDSLKYGYVINSNKLSFVTDRKNNPQSQLGDFKEISNDESADYSYDQNGNLTTDNNKHITGITYNHLNLPQTVTIPDKGTIRYLYDASGNKLRKEVTDISSGVSKTTTTDYIAGIVYQNDTLQFLAHEEGRIRALVTAGNPIAFRYDYFLKDHLGNIRTVLTEQTDFSMYTATMETGAAAKENILFSNIDNTRVNKPSGYPTDESAGANASVAKLTAADGGRKIGPSLVLHVMAGDTIQLGVKAFYKSPGQDKKSSAYMPAEAMLADLIHTFTPGDQMAGPHSAATERPFTPFDKDFYNNHYQQLKDNNTDKTQASRPRAYLNFVVFDEQFKLVEGNSGVRQVKAAPDQLQTLSTDKIPIQRNGYLYVYTSNETQEVLFFDNLMVSQISGPLLEETHYYPFGLTMAGISSNALKGTNYSKNRREFNGIEHTTDLDLNQYDAFYRNLDPQIGRWWQVDPKENDAISPYTAMENNPIRYSDFLGDTTMPGAGFWRNIWEGIKEGGRSTKQWVKSLGTLDGWGNTLDGIAAFSPFNVDEGSVNARTHMIDQAVNYVADIPNKTKDQIGHDLGYGAEKVGESVIVSKGGTLIENGARVLGEVAESGSSLLQGGRTFAQYKAARGGTETLARIPTSTGVQRVSTEFHHVFITQRAQRAYNIPNWLVNNRLNVWKVNTVQHALIDSYRYNFLRAGFKSDVGWFRRYNWFTKF